MPENGNLLHVRWTTILFAAVGEIKTRTLEIPLNDHLQNVFYSFQLDLWVSLNLAYLCDISNTIHFLKFRTNKTDDQVLLWKPSGWTPLFCPSLPKAWHPSWCQLQSIWQPDHAHEQTNSPWVTMFSSPPTVIVRQASLCRVLLLCLPVSHKWDWAFPVSNLLCFTYMTHVTQLRVSNKLLAFTVTQEQWIMEMLMWV